MAEVVSLEKQRLIGRLREGVGENVADVELSGVTAFAVVAEGFGGDCGLMGAQIDDIEISVLEQPFQIGATFIAFSPFYDKCKLHAGHRGHKASGCALDQFGKIVGLRFAKQYGHDRRRIDHHQVHMPVSS